MTTKSKPRAKRGMSDRQAEAFASRFRKQPAQMTSDQVRDIERRFTETSGNGVTRRAALASLARSGQELIDAVVKNREAAVGLAETAFCANEYADRLRMFAEWMSTASLRLNIALAFRDDMQQVIEEARRG